MCSANVVNVINLQLLSGASSLFAHKIVHSSNERTPLEVRNGKKFSLSLNEEQQINMSSSKKKKKVQSSLKNIHLLVLTPLLSNARGDQVTQLDQDQGAN